MRYFFAWLGSKRAAKQDVAEPGCLLDRAANANLPVPAGGILLHNFYELLLEEHILEENEGQVTASSADALHEMLFNLAHFPKIDAPMVIRPLHPTDFGPTLAPVRTDNPTQLTNSLCEGWSTQNGRHDLLLISLPEIARRGTAVSPPNGESDQLTLSDKATTPLPRLTRWQRPDDSLPPHAQRLQMLLRGLRRTFGDDGWEIEWVDDGRICWLWELRTPTSEDG
ncbi:MAG: hypothetical protein DHS20C20_29200 [Ardenticatenaceae bacterium]|nr:MAG: hypothetical protein DHS20C20_29200 [Ardenticatenaceae bacterium]